MFGSTVSCPNQGFNESMGYDSFNINTFKYTQPYYNLSV